MKKPTKRVMIAVLVIAVLSISLKIYVKQEMKDIDWIELNEKYKEQERRRNQDVNLFSNKVVEYLVNKDSLSIKRYYFDEIKEDTKIRAALVELMNSFNSNKPSIVKVDTVFTSSPGYYKLKDKMTYIKAYVLDEQDLYEIYLSFSETPDTKENKLTGLTLFHNLNEICSSEKVKPYLPDGLELLGITEHKDGFLDEVYIVVDNRTEFDLEGVEFQAVISNGNNILLNDKYSYQPYNFRKGKKSVIKLEEFESTYNKGYYNKESKDNIILNLISVSPKPEPLACSKIDEILNGIDGSSKSELRRKKLNGISIPIHEDWNIEKELFEESLDWYHLILFNKDETSMITIMSQEPHAYINGLDELAEYYNEKFVRNLKATGLILTPKRIESKEFKGVNGNYTNYNSVYSETGEKGEFVSINFIHENYAYTIFYVKTPESEKVVSNVVLN